METDVCIKLLIFILSWSSFGLHCD